MAVKMKFDSARNVVTPTIVLATRSGKKLGAIPSSNLHFNEFLNSGNTIDFKVINDKNNKISIWDEIVDFKLIWCKEWDAWFEITVEIEEGNDLIKSVNGVSLGEAELSVISLYEIEINTEDDIAQDDYVPTVLYDSFNHRASLLHRIFEKIPHYTIKYIDPHLINIQRTFTFDGISILDALHEIAEEEEIIFILSQHSDEDGKPERGIYVYDLLDYCQSCGARGNFISSTCSECGSQNIEHGYGDDTTIFISNENIATEITYTTDTSSVCSCFRMEAGDDLMTSTIMNINPNGTQYLWYVSDEIKKDMSDELVSKLEEYDRDYEYYQTEYTFSLGEYLDDYNLLINKYQLYNAELSEITDFVGYPALIDAIYNAIDFEIFLSASFMPTREKGIINAATQAALINSTSMNSIAVSDLSIASSSTVEMSVLSFAKAMINSHYTTKAKNSNYNSISHIWSGVITVQNYSDDEDVADSVFISIPITDRYSSFVEQKVQRMLFRSDDDGTDIVALFSLEGSDFANELQKYCLQSLKNFHSNCQSCIDIYIQQGYSNFSGYSSKLSAIDREIKLRENEIAIINNLKEDAYIARNIIQKELNFEGYLGERLWKEFCSYRRESTFKNQNYISDGLSNALLIENARDFIQVARKELIRSATLQHSISSSLNNLLVIPGFEKILDNFKVGNWLRVKIDGKIYKLRLLSYLIDFEKLQELSVEFSDVIRIGNEITDVESILKQSSSMASSYNAVERQSNINYKTTKTVDTWFERGLNATLVNIINTADRQTMQWDEHGMLFRSYDDVSDTYSYEQLKIINSTIAITDDYWETTKTAIGKFIYEDPVSNVNKVAYGINGETIVGKLILGQQLGIYNSDGSLTFDSEGLTVSNETNTINIDPNKNAIFTITKGNSTILEIDQAGVLNITGVINATSGTFSGEVNATSGNFSGSITTTSGSIAGWEIDTGSLTSGSLGTSGSVCLFSTGSSETAAIGGLINPISGWTITSGENFGVTTNGTLYAKGANLSGSIYANSLTAHSKYSIFGLDKYSDDGSGTTFDIIRAFSRGGTKTVMFSTKFYPQSTSTEFGNDYICENGLTIYQGSKSKVYIFGDDLFLGGSRGSLYSDSLEINASTVTINNDNSNSFTFSNGEISLDGNISCSSLSIGNYGISSSGVLSIYSINAGSDITCNGSFTTIGNITGSDLYADDILCDSLTTRTGGSVGSISCTNLTVGGTATVASLSLNGDLSCSDLSCVDIDCWDIDCDDIGCDQIDSGEINASGRITASGGLYVGTSNSSANMHLYGTLYYDGVEECTGTELQVVTTGHRVGYSSSSKRYKDHIGMLPNREAEKLYDIPVIQFKYKKGRLKKDDEFYDKIISGIYAEDLDELFDDVALHNSHGQVETFKDRQILVRLIKLAQIQHQEIESLQATVNNLYLEMRG